jgi:2-isopropylmalate synthase
MDGVRSSAGVVGPRLAEVGLKTADVCEAGSLLLLEYGVEPPPELLGEFAAVIGTGWRVGSDTAAAEQVWDMFEREYLLREPVSALLIRCTARRADISRADPWIALFNIRQSLGTGQESPVLVVSAFLTAMGLDVSVLSRHSQVLENSGLTIAYVKCLAGLPAWGVGIGGDLAAASLKAVLSAVNRAGPLRSGHRSQEAARESG